MSRRARTVGGLAALALVCALLVGATASAKVPRSFFGIVPQAPLGAEDYERMGEAQVGTLRFELAWAKIDPSAAADDYDWAATDTIVGDAARNGIRTLPFVYSTPPWVAAIDGHPCSDDACYPYAPRKPAALEAWRAFLSAAVKRYGPSGEFWTANPEIPKRPIRVWQLWNEQNSPSFYKPRPKVRAYARLLAAGHEAITRADRGAEIVLGGMFGTPLGGQKPGIAAWDFVGDLYDVRGAKRTFDGIAPHPYAAQFSKVLAQIDLIRDEIRAARDGRVDLWITEIGWGSATGGNPLNRGPRGQASRLSEAFAYFEAKRKKLNIRNVDWYSWRDNRNANAGLCDWCPMSGLTTEELDAKPSLRAFTDLTGGR